MTATAAGGGVKAEGSGEMVMEKGGDGVMEEGEGDVVEANHPQPPNKLTLPQWLLKALGPISAAPRKAPLVAWSPRALEEGCARDELLFAGAS